MMLERDVTIGMSLIGALTSAGLGGSCVVPYHDTHFSIGHSLHQGSPFIDDRQL